MAFLPLFALGALPPCIEPIDCAQKLFVANAYKW
jgi:hypothetical protein